MRDMATILTTRQDNDAAWNYLIQARKHFTQAQIAEHLEIDQRTVRRWELRQVPIIQLLGGLQSSYFWIVKLVT